VSKTVSFRSKFQSFWEQWTEKVLALPRDNTSNTGSSIFGTGAPAGSRKVNGLDILRNVVDQLVSLSSMAVVNIRDSVTEAALSVAKSILDGCANAKAEVITSQRQIAAAEIGKTKEQALQNPKYVACLKQQHLAKKELETLTGFVNTIFNSVFVHRARDFHDQVRTTSMQHLYRFVVFDLEKPIRSEYLKYLGWACSDFAAAVRMHAVHAIHRLVQVSAPGLLRFSLLFRQQCFLRWFLCCFQTETGSRSGAVFVQFRGAFYGSLFGDGCRRY
jgi:hypothetical protein